MNKITRYWYFFLVVGCLFITKSSQAQWVQSTKFGDVGYFLMGSSSPRLERFALTNSQWLPPINLPSVYGAPTAFSVDSEGIYVAFGQTVRGYDSDGKKETALVTTPDAVSGLFTDGKVLFINRSDYLYARFTSVNKTNGAVIATFENYINAVSGASIARSVHKIFGRSVGISPSDITYVTYNTDGTFATGGDSPYHGSYPSATKTWVFPGDAKVVDSSGIVYSTDSLTYLNSFGTSIVDLDFYGTNIPIVLSGTNLTAYSSSLLPSGTVALSYQPQTIYVAGTNVITFISDASKTNGIRFDPVPLTALNPPLPNQPVDPRGLAYTPDNYFLDGKGVLYLVSKSQQSIFRWDTVQQSYLSTISLVGVPSYVAYSEINNTIYLAYASGLIRQINLNSIVKDEIPFANLPMAPIGLAAAGQYVFAMDHSGAWGTHYTFTPSGILVSSKDWNYYSSEFIWCDTNQKMYFFRDDTSPNDILWEQINASGFAYSGVLPGGIGTEIDSPLHQSDGWTHPIRVAPDGSIVVFGSGLIHNATTLERSATGLGNTVNDIAWCDGQIKTIRTISGVMQCQDWSLNNYGLNKVRQFPGNASRLMALSQSRMVAVALLGGVPSFSLLDGDFHVIAPSVLQAPSGVLPTIQSSSVINLTWTDVSGEEGYLIERKTGTNGNWSQLGTASVSSTNFFDTSVIVGNLYSYRVSATNGTKTSATSSEAFVGFVAPTTPINITATSLSPTAIRLGWADVAFETAYLLERKTGTGSWSQIAVYGAGTVACTNSSLSQDTQYFYRISATNQLGSSLYSEVVTATTDAIVPSAPTISSAVATNAFLVTVSWLNVSYEQNYIIERSTGLTGAWSQVGATPADITIFQDRTVSPLTSYSYRVYATNRAGASPVSGQVSVVTPQIPPPSQPQGLFVKAASASTLTVAWMDVATETGYRLQRRTEDTNSWVQVSLLSSNVTSCLDTNLTRGVRYYYRIQAFNEYGASVFSAETSAIPNNIVRLVEDTFDPAIHWGIWASVDGGIATNFGTGFAYSNALWFGAESSRGVTTVPLELYYGGTLNFAIRAGNESADGNSFWNNSENGENVVIEYSKENGPWTLLQTLNTVYPAATNWVNFSIPLPDASCSLGTQFRFRQLSHSGPGYDCWALDNFWIEGAAPLPPVAPSFMITSPSSSTSISIWWAEATGATCYIVERKQGKGPWTPLAQVSCLETYYEDNSALPSSAYSYRVKSVNGGGQSGYSMLSTAVTWSQMEQWSYDNFGSVDAATRTQMADSPDWLLRYAFNLSAEESPRPIQPGFSTSGIPTVRVDSTRGKLCIEYIRRREAMHPEIIYQVESSDNLGSWTQCNGDGTPTAIDSLWEQVRYEEPVNRQSSARFFRVTVRLQ